MAAHLGLTAATQMIMIKKAVWNHYGQIRGRLPEAGGGALSRTSREALSTLLMSKRITRSRFQPEHGPNLVPLSLSL